MTTANELYTEGFQLHQQGKLEDAEVLYSQALTIDPNNLNCLFMMANLKYQQFRFPEAEKFIKRAIELNQNIRFYDLLSRIKIEKKEYSINQKNEIIKSVGLSEIKPIILVFGGSQGAQKINEAIIGILTENLNKNYQIMWATGPKQYEIIKEELNKSNFNVENIPNAKIVPYIYNMEEIMNISSVIVSRSGAMTITEISNLGKPSILIPLPNVSQDHQLYNAKVLENVGAAKIILNNELTKNNLNEAINSIVTNTEKIKVMGQNALKQASYNTQDKIYIEIKETLDNYKKQNK